MRHTFLKPLLFAVFAVSPAMSPVVARAQTAPETPTEPQEFDLSPNFDRWDLGLKGQLQRDTCAVFTITGALEYGVSKNLDEGVRFSEEYLNWAANDASGDENDGASFVQLQAGFSKWGIAEQTEMPYQRVFSGAVPSQSAVAGAHEVWQLKPKWNWIARERAQGLNALDIAAAKRVIKRGFPVAAGGPHCLLLVGFFDNWEGGGTFLARDYARQAYETLTYADAMRRFESMVWVEFPVAKSK